MQFLDLVDKVNLDKTWMRKTLGAEVERMNKFTADVLEMEQSITIPKMDVRGYTKYVLKNWKVEEKREMLGCLKTHCF